MVTLGIILGVIVTLGIIAAISSGYKERFGRNFIFNGSAWGVIIGEVLMLGSFGYVAAEAPPEKDPTFGLSCEETVWSFIDCAYSFSSEIIVAIITFSPEDYSPAVAEYADPISGIFIFGLICVVIAWYTNISSSSLGWGMAQNILQTIIVTSFSILFVAALVLAAVLFDKADPSTKRKLDRAASKALSRDGDPGDDDY